MQQCSALQLGQLARSEGRELVCIFWRPPSPGDLTPGKSTAASPDGPAEADVHLGQELNTAERV